MEDDAPLLDTAVVAPSDDLAIDHQHRADRDPALISPHPRFVQRRLEEHVHRL